MSTVEPPRLYSRSALPPDDDGLGTVGITRYIPDNDPAAAVARLKERHAGVPIWFGNSTRRYWAILGGQLVEAADSTELDSVLDSARPLPAVVPYGLVF